MSKAAKLKKAAKSASEVRAYQTDPDVVALRVEVVRTWVDRLVWTGMVLGLLFTMANVQSFASHGTKMGSIDWVIAWLLDPMVSLVLIGVLMGEQVINRHKVQAGPWVRVTKWVALGCTYGMNTWQAWAAHDPAKILLHSVPPLIVVCAAEAVTDLRMSITKAVDTAYEAATARSQDQSPMVPAPVPATVQDQSPAVPATVLDGPQDHNRAVPGPVPATVQDQSQDHDDTVLVESQDRPPKRSRARHKAKAKPSAKGRVTQAEWENRIRQAVADHPGITMQPSPIATVLGLDQKTRASGGFKRAVTAVREEGELPSVRAIGA